MASTVMAACLDCPEYPAGHAKEWEHDGEVEEGISVLLVTLLCVDWVVDVQSD
jgi:hypothetical protein